LSLLKTCSGFGIDWPMDEGWRSWIACNRASFAIASERCKDEKGTATRAETGRSIDRRDSSGGATFVAIMQATDLWKRDDLACRNKLDASRVGTILV
jgi:hypothetical protein